MAASSPPTPREVFALAYAERCGVTVEWLKDKGREARPCDCDYAQCEGWQMAYVGLEAEMGNDWPIDSPKPTDGRR